jgi:hypothetical protein
MALADQDRGRFSSLALRSIAMLPAIGAASFALDAVQSLTSPQSSSSQPIDFGPLTDTADNSSSSPGSATASGFSSAQISSDNINALLSAQSLSSGSLSDSIDPGSSASDPSQQGQSASATSAYSAINQLAQSAAVPLGLSPVSISA